MQILLATHFFSPKYSTGTDKYTLGLAQSFKESGHEVQVICAEDWQSGDSYWNGVSEDTYKNIHVHRIHLNWTKADNPNKVLYDSKLVEDWFYNYLKQQNIDMVHVTSAYTLGVGILRAANKARKPLVLTLMDFWFACPRITLLQSNGQLCNGITSDWECQNCLLRNNKYYKLTEQIFQTSLLIKFWNFICQNPKLSRHRFAKGTALDVYERKVILQQILTLPDVVISHSNFLKNFYQHIFKSLKVKYLPNGHDLSWIDNYTRKTVSQKIRIGYIGQISYHKGIHILVDAFVAATKENKATLSIWGDISKNSYYDNYLCEYAQNIESIEFRGYFLPHQIGEVLSEIDVIIVPSLWYENAPLIIFEAFASKTPVIVTNLGGMAEIISYGVNGLLFKQGDVEDLAEQISRLINEDDLINQLKSGIPIVKDISKEVDELELIYLKILSNN